MVVVLILIHSLRSRFYIWHTTGLLYAFPALFTKPSLYKPRPKNIHFSGWFDCFFLSLLVMFWYKCQQRRHDWKTESLCIMSRKGKNPCCPTYIEFYASSQKTLINNKMWLSWWGNIQKYKASRTKGELAKSFDNLVLKSLIKHVRIRRHQVLGSHLFIQSYSHCKQSLKRQKFRYACWLPLVVAVR